MSLSIQRNFIQRNLDQLSLPSSPEILRSDTKEQELKKKMWHQYQLRQHHRNIRDIYDDAIINQNEKRDEFNRKWRRCEAIACTRPLDDAELEQIRDMMTEKYDIIHYCIHLVGKKEEELTNIRKINIEIGHLKLLLFHRMRCDESSGVRIYEYIDE